METTDRPGIFLANFLQGFAKTSLSILNLNRPSLPSSLPLGAEIINRPAHYRVVRSAKDATMVYHERKKNNDWQEGEGASETSNSGGRVQNEFARWSVSVRDDYLLR